MLNVGLTSLQGDPAAVPRAFPLVPVLLRVELRQHGAVLGRHAAPGPVIWNPGVREAFSQDSAVTWRDREETQTSGRGWWAPWRTETDTARDVRAPRPHPSATCSAYPAAPTQRTGGLGQFDSLGHLGAETTPVQAACPSAPLPLASAVRASSSLPSKSACLAQGQVSHKDVQSEGPCSQSKDSMAGGGGGGGGIIP